MASFWSRPTMMNEKAVLLPTRAESIWADTRSAWLTRQASRSCRSYKTTVKFFVGLQITGPADGPYTVWAAGGPDNDVKLFSLDSTGLLTAGTPANIVIPPTLPSDQGFVTRTTLLGRRWPRRRPYRRSSVEQRAPKSPFPQACNSARMASTSTLHAMAITAWRSSTPRVLRIRSCNSLKVTRWF